MKKLVSLFLAGILAVSCMSATVFAEERDVTTPSATLNADGSVTFSNLDSVALNQFVEFELEDPRGEEATIGIQKIQGDRSSRANSATYKVYYYTAAINSSFFMVVTNNVVTSVYDKYILTVGCTFSDASLTRTNTYGKLSFTTTTLWGIASSTCWLKGTVTGSNNNITASVQY